ncbi:hypothetical protein [Streptomyces sp. UNOC14_S4]|uniref:hypothetical protein n=1 Tax=Streptomyces sp. UNOC14_S4 TaxID=2872340 RepID=UPI001E571B72|nr:hypothetical protein [Streptomyces sp. UNOC14_S4]MCC3769665.1 hypothetical protein [Streptomyces sp. UNOC14_S4]
MTAIAEYREPGKCIRRIMRCVISYVLVFALGWLLIALTGPRPLKSLSSSFEHSSFGDSLLYYAGAGLTMLVMIGLPSIVIILIAGLLRKKMGSKEFRALVAGLLLLPVWPLLLVGTHLILYIQIGVQVVFAVALMPVPLLPPPVAVNIGRRP